MYPLAKDEFSFLYSIVSVYKQYCGLCSSWPLFHYTGSQFLEIWTSGLSAQFQLSNAIYHSNLKITRLSTEKQDILMLQAVAAVRQVGQSASMQMKNEVFS